MQDFPLIVLSMCRFISIADLFTIQFFYIPIRTSLLATKASNVVCARMSPMKYSKTDRAVCDPKGLIQFFLQVLNLFHNVQFHTSARSIIIYEG